MIGAVPVYRPTGSALHATRPGVAIAFCAACGMPAVLLEGPLALAASIACIVAAGLAAGVSGELVRAARLGLPLALLVTLVNPLVSQQGLTVIFDGPIVPVLGNLDVTLEALAFGAAAGLRVLAVIGVFALYSACVDPDEVLRLVGRLAPRSALTASLATRTVPVLGRDAARLAEAYELRAAPVETPGHNRVSPVGTPGHNRVPPLRTPGRRRASFHKAATLTRALAAGTLERSVELASALEVRGYAGGRRLAPRDVPWSRHDLAFALAGLALALASAGGRLAGLDGFGAYPLLHLEAGPADLAFAASLPLLALAPFAVAARKRRSLRRSLVHA